ncbi:MAG: methylated-DNA--[protein]-cysteine S-methyltransferase [Muribaculaceae bacterium]|nr:methylated-DNA--[protein]-cysteine S-methyltransferase [Muribaculaceae bacterium]
MDTAISSRGVLPVVTARYDSPCGPLVLGATEGSLCMCDWERGRHATSVARALSSSVPFDRADSLSDVLAGAIRQLDEYFAGERKDFDVPLLLTGTPFRMAVWRALREVPYGQTLSYSALARRIGRPAAVRAVASAVGANPISIFVPCHRIIGASGALTGYAGGLDAKRRLLALESESRNFY